MCVAGPSPDWVVGVSGLELCQKDCTWTESKVIDLYPYDAGTDNGISYMVRLSYLPLYTCTVLFVKTKAKKEHNTSFDRSPRTRKRTLARECTASHPCTPKTRARPSTTPARRRFCPWPACTSPGRAWSPAPAMRRCFWLRLQRNGRTRKPLTDVSN